MSDLRNVLTPSPMIPQNNNKGNTIVEKVKDSELLDPQNDKNIFESDAFAMQVNTTDKDVTVNVSLPEGFDGNQLETSVSQGNLRIKGQFDKHVKRESDHGLFESSLSQSVCRSVLLPDNCTADKLQRSIEGDQLKIVIPRDCTKTTKNSSW